MEAASSAMPEHQTSLPFDATGPTGPVRPDDLRDEIARVWGLPLGERVEVGLRGESLEAVTGTLELAAAPHYPWNPREVLHLQVNGFAFSSRAIAHWQRL
jgi:hypothetical protein